MLAVIFATAVLALVGGEAPAIAAGPEAPETQPVSNRYSTSAELSGMLDPHIAAPVEPGTYQFLYKATKAPTKAECESAGAGRTPESPGLYLGLEPEYVYEFVSGLMPGTEYVVCLSATDEGGTTVGAPVAFTTRRPPQTPTGEEAHAAGYTATLKGVLDPTEAGEPGTWEFIYNRSESECQGGGRAPQPEGVSDGSSPEPVSVEVGGLLPATTYTFCLRAVNAAGEEALGAPVTFTTTTAQPAVAEESFSKVGRVSAAVQARVNAGGQPASYWAEYGTTSGYGQSTVPAGLAASGEPAGVRVELDGLLPETIYHFRIVARNAGGTVPGPDVTLTTFPDGLLGLPDGRGYEMVTPARNENAEVYAPRADNPTEEAPDTSRPVRAAANGDAVAYVGDPTAGGNGSQGAGAGNEYLARRGPEGGWTQTALQPAGLSSPVYAAFSSDLSIGVLTSSDALSPGAPSSNEDLYTRTADGAFHAFFAEPLPEKMFVATIEGYSRGLGEFYGGASSDFTHTLFQAANALTPNAVSGLAERADNLYASVNGQPRLVNVLPDGTTRPGAFFGAPPETPEDPPGLEHAISSDGSLIYWTDVDTTVTPEDPAGATRLFVRESGTRTVQVDASQAPRGEGAKERQERLARSGGGLFWAATSDGSKVFFTDCSRLTESSTAVSGQGCGQRPALTGADLYEYEPSTGELTDLTIDHNGADPLGADVQGVVSESENGSYLYFVADGDLAAGASSGQPNLYLLHNGATTFIATLSQGDDSLGYVSFGSIGDWSPTVGHRTAEATPDGRSLVFLSSDSLTGYENRSMEEAYVYDAETDRISCASCDPSGEPPTPSGTAGLDVELPPGQREDGTYQLRLISEDGSRVFFQSIEPLVPQDTNQRTDVYEWERDGAGSCTRPAGCVYLLSGGTNASGSYLLDASANGDDVFIITRAQLSPEDQNENYDLYDVRVGAVAPLPAPQCTGAGCQGSPPEPPIFATPASVTFNGAGNLSPAAPRRVVKPKARPPRQQRGLARALRRCRHAAARRRSACEKRARQRNRATTKRSTTRRGK